MDSEVAQTLVQILAVLLVISVMSDKWLHPVKPVFSHLQKGGNFLVGLSSFHGFMLWLSIAV